MCLNVLRVHARCSSQEKVNKVLETTAAVVDRAGGSSSYAVLVLFLRGLATYAELHSKATVAVIPYTQLMHFMLQQFRTHVVNTMSCSTDTCTYTHSIYAYLYPRLSGPSLNVML